MAFDLPRSPRSLRFTGEVRALGVGEEEGPNALARPRPKAPAPVPVARVTTPTRLTTMRGQMASVGDEDVMTLCLDRDALDIAQLPDARAGKNLPLDPKAGPHLPVPHFRSKDEVARHNHEPTVIARAPKGGALPLGVWLFAALIAGVVSFHFAPQARESVQEAVRALDAR